jgi:hypothetical protein
VATFLDERRSGRTGGQAVFAALGARDPAALVTEVSGVHVAARLRPVVLRLAGGDGLDGRLQVAADLGTAALAVHAEPGDAHLDAIRALRAFEERRLESAPLISVVVCAYNAEDDLDRCLRSLARTDYPRMEIVVVDDGSEDGTLDVARRHGVRLVELGRRGLSVARNTGAEVAEGEIVAFLDADAEATPDWLTWAWRGLDRTGADGITGPNLPFPDAGLQERAVSGAPGAPVPAVDPDGSAAHLPGCSMIFRREVVREIGFDADLRTGEDVAFCDEALRRGHRLVYHPTAIVFHHRRATLAGYLKQQRSYGGLLSFAPDALRITGATSGRTPLRSRANPLKRRHVFGGAQEAGLYAQREFPANTQLPFRAAVLATSVIAAAFPFALVARRPGAWLRGSLTFAALLFAVAAARVPVPVSRPGTRLIQRCLTAFLWISQPVAHRLGTRRAHKLAEAGTEATVR